MYPTSATGIFISISHLIEYIVNYRHTCCCCGNLYSSDGWRNGGENVNTAHNKLFTRSVFKKSLIFRDYSRSLGKCSWSRPAIKWITTYSKSFINRHSYYCSTSYTDGKGSLNSHSVSHAIKQRHTESRSPYLRGLGLASMVSAL
jgi:hypothetical protein